MISLDIHTNNFYLSSTPFRREYNDDEDCSKMPVGPPPGGFFLPDRFHPES
jgi:hypothetical protein